MFLTTRSGTAILCVLLWTSAAAGQTGPKPVSPWSLGPRITILSIGSEDLGLQTLRTAISAHLSAYGVSVEILVVAPEAASAPPLEIARRALAQRDAMAVVWVDAAQGVFTALIADATAGDQTLTRELPVERDVWVASCDGLASTLHAALIPRLRVGDDAPQEPAPSATDVEPQPQPDKDEEADPAPQRKLKGDLAVLVNLGYGAVILNSSGEVQHGARTAFGLSFRHGFEAIVGLDLLFPYEAGSEAAGSGGNVRLVRWPLRLAAGWFYTARKVHIGARLGLVLDFSRIRGWNPPAGSDSLSGEETARTNPGLMASIRVRADLAKFLSFYLEVMGDWFSHTYIYEIGGREVIRFGAVQIGFIAGISVQFDVR